MTTARPALLISDACVLIDYCKADGHDILRLVSSHFLPIHAPQRVLDEVEQLTEDDLERLGIRVLEVTMQHLQDAAVRGGPSQQDRLCFLVARDHGGAVWSNDKRLRKLCREHNVQHYWGLEVLLILVRSGHLDRQRARATAERLHRVDPHYVPSALLKDFCDKLERQ